MELQKRKKKNILKIPLLVFLAIVLFGMVIIFGLFHIRTVDVIGNEFYSAEEIQNMIMSDSLAENSIYLTWKYSDPETAEALPFLSAIEVSMISPYHVQIRVYEKTIAGYLMYSGSRVYFDTDGNVVEISGEERDGVPPFSGISIGQPTVGEKLPVEDESFLSSITETAQMLRQSGLEPDEIHYDEKQEAIIYFGTRRVMLGSSDYMEEKISNLKALFPQMEGLSGTLHLETYTPSATTISFKKGEKGEEEDELLMNLNQPEETGGEGEQGDGASGETEGETTGETTVDSGSSGYVEDPSRITTDADGNQIYTDEQGNVTSNMDMPYLGDDGQIVTDGYGYIDPYTGAYILN
ncbi:MAG: cell division protein FtsQ/DivIB [Eubacteriales bacterium]|nr:cell division protein FtsQ/DivIB [Eubacteriales bacterium]